MKRLAIAAAILSATAWAQEPRVIRTMGDREMRTTMLAWESEFRKQHSEVIFDDKLLGSATGMAGIITDASDITLLGRRVTANEVIGFEWVHRMKPMAIEVARGALSGEGRSPALAAMVAERNPVRMVTMAQLAGVLGCPADAAKPVTWAMLGATGAWAARAVHVYLFDDQTGTGAFLQQAVQGKRDCWNWDVVREFKDERGKPAAQQIADALERDRDGLALTTMQYAGPKVRALALDGVELNTTTASDGSYALGRGIYAYVNPKTAPRDTVLIEFLWFCISEVGQKIVAAQGEFLPLNAATAESELAKLK